MPRRPARAGTASAEVADADTLRASLDAALGTLVVVEKERHLLLWEGVRIHLDTVHGLGSFVELEGVAAAGSDLQAEHEKVARLREALQIEEILTDSYSDRLLGADALIAGGHRRDGQRARAVLELSRRAPRCAPRTVRSTPARTSRTPPTRRASAPRRPRSACWSPPAVPRCSRPP